MNESYRYLYFENIDKELCLSGDIHDDHFRGIPTNQFEVSGVVPPTTWMEVDLSALDENVSHLRNFLHPHVGIMGIAKADAYGLGLVPIVERLFRNKVEKVGVSSVQEVVKLRSAGIKDPVVCLYPPQMWDITPLVKKQAEITVDTIETVEQIAQEAKREGVRAKVHIMVETGMNRYGVSSAEVLLFAEKIKGMDHIQIEGIYTHFATASRDLSSAMTQMDDFIAILLALKNHGIHIPTVHVANSAAILNLPDSIHPDTFTPFFHGTKVFVRPGGLLYGIDESLAQRSPHLPMKSVLGGIVSHISETKEILSGNSVGYGKRFTTEYPMSIATLPVGFGNDGFMIRESDVLIKGKRCKILGLVASSGFAIENSAGAKRGERVLLIGEENGERVSLDEVASRNGMITMQLLTMLGSRIQRVYKERE